MVIIQKLEGLDLIITSNGEGGRLINLVLHGGSGILRTKFEKEFAMGISKVNV